MKKNQLHLANLLIFSLFALFSCSSDSEQATTDEAVNETPVEVVVNSNYQLDAATSKADWERTLDQKPTKQKVKLFGSMVDVQLGAVKLNTNGNVNVTSGELNTSNEEVTDASVVVDMASIKFAEEKGKGLLDAKQYPNSTLELKNFSLDSTGYTAEGMLTIHKTSKPVIIS